jgi:protein SCO1/2
MFLKKRIVQIFVIILIVTSSLFYYQKKNKKVPIGGNFKLVNHLGNNTTSKDFKNNFLLVFFGFTNCPDICPNTLNNISKVMDQLDKNVSIIPLFITVDPERDTVEVLKKYLTNFHPKIIGLTGTNEQIDSVKKKYKIFSKKVMQIEKESHVDHGDYGVDHATIIYLMDKKGNYLTHFGTETNSSLIIEKINQYI